MDTLIGKQLGNFIIKERIGRGGMAMVYRAHQEGVNRDVALKIIQIDTQVSGLDDFRVRFEQEAHLIASLEHIYVLPVYDYGIQDDVAYLAMRFLPGGTLQDLIEEGAIPLSRAVELFTQAARGLAYAHSRGIIHRDLKPSNLMLDDEGHINLTDFGLAKLISGEEEITRTGNIVGTPTYMSPEQLRGEALDARADVYSMGIVLYQMLTGKPPFKGGSSDVVTVIYQHLEKDPEPPTKINASIPRAVERVILKALSKERDKRYGSMGEMIADLRAAAGVKPESSSYPAVAVPLVQSKTTSNIKWLIPAGILMVLFVSFIGILLLTNGDLASKKDVPQATVLTGERGVPADVVPTNGEISTARTRVGDNFVAIIACNRTSEYHAGVVREMIDFFNEYDIASRIYDSENDEGRQIAQIEQARSDGATGIIVCPLNIHLLDDVLSSVERAGLPLALYSPREDGHAYGGFAIVGNDYELGYKPGLFAGALIRDELGGEADVIILDFPDMPVIVERANGLEAGVLENAPDANIVGRYTGAIRDLGYDSVSQLIEDGVPFDVIVSINDAGSYGAIDALQEANISPQDVIIVSVDGEALAREYIREGNYIRGSVAIDRTATAQALVNGMVKLLAGGTIPAGISAQPGDIITRETLANE